MAAVSTAVLSRRLTGQEHREAARLTIARYMDLCDVPRPSAPGQELAALFTPDAVWEGVGPEYSGKFGRVEGRERILRMLKSFLPPTTHFRTNIHLLGEGKILFGDASTTGQWIMQQISEYDDGRRELIIARLNVDFVVEGEIALISHFQTEKLFVHALGTETKIQPLLDPQLKEYR
ncbi:nuclear transport factor 2 family protein [Arthrobacter sp. R4]|uniref:nuclear transport factor 2 family protein n=1 Tax=Arthrobacter sp. R4 TaxID=644417 RepID=UPI003ED86859